MVRYNMTHLFAFRDKNKQRAEGTEAINFKRQITFLNSTLVGKDQRSFTVMVGHVDPKYKGNRLPNSFKGRDCNF